MLCSRCRRQAWQFRVMPLRFEDGEFDRCDDRRTPRPRASPHDALSRCRATSSSLRPTAWAKPLPSTSMGGLGKAVASPIRAIEDRAA